MELEQRDWHQCEAQQRLPRRHCFYSWCAEARSCWTFFFTADTHTDTAAKWLIKKKTGQDFCICPCRRWETTYGVNKVLQKLWQIAKRHIYSFFVCLHSSYKHTPNPYNLFPTEWKSSENISKKCFISKAFLLRLPVNIGNNYRKSVGTLQQHPIYGFRTLFLGEIVF